jgi:GH25 family lysozyme M1 (1,4-beta-N-acetylmuramidase)
MIFVDVSHWNPEDAAAAGRVANQKMDWNAAVAAGLWGAVIKYSQGSDGVDPAAMLHAYNAYSAHVPLLGAYHFGNDEDGGVQAKHFLDCVRQDYGKDLTGVMLMLDAERNSPQMDVPTAEAFVQAIHDDVVRWPWIYMGKFGPDGTGTGLPSTVLANCPLLVAAYGDHENDMSAIMPQGFVVPTDAVSRAGVCRGWQFTDGTHNGGPFPGLGVVDQSKFIGIQTLDEARALWAS